MFRICAVVYWSAVLTILILGQLPAFAQTWNLAQNWSGTNNPNGAWSYRSHFYPADERRLLPYHVSNYGGGTLDAWQDQNGYTTPVVLKNVGTSAYSSAQMTMPAGTVVLQPNSQDWAPYVWPVYVKWTAPEDAQYTFTATFTGRTPGGNQLDTTIFRDYDWALGQPPVILHSGQIKAYLGVQSYTGTVWLQAGQTLDFMVHHINDVMITNNACGLNVVINQVTPQWNLARDWSGSSNPTGNGWSYRAHLYPSDTHELLDYPVSNYLGSGLGAWQTQLGYASPVALKNTNTTQYSGNGMVIPAGKVIFCPNRLGWAPWTWPVYTTWTAPANGDYRVSATYTARSPAMSSGLSVYVFKDYIWPIGQPSVQLFSGNITNYLGTQHYDGVVSLTTGQTLDFLVHNLGNVFIDQDNACQVDVTITGSSIFQQYNSTMAQLNSVLGQVAALNPTQTYYQGRRALFLKSLGDKYYSSLQSMYAISGFTDIKYLNYALRGLAFAQAALTLAQDPLARAAYNPPTRPLTYSASFGAQKDICINGKWQCAFGGSPNTPPSSGWLNINVPHDMSPDIFPTLLGLPTPTSPMWYKTTFFVPADWNTKVVKACFESVTHYTEVFLNGYYCGNHVGSFSPFEVDLTGALQPGATNVLTVYAENESYSGLPGATEQCLYSAYPYTTTPKHIGIHGDVFVKASPMVFVSKNLIDTDMATNNFHVRTSITNRDSVAHNVTLTNTAKTMAGATAKSIGSTAVSVPANSTVTVTMDQGWTGYAKWGIGNSTYGYPDLYSLESTLADGSVVDTSYTRFGWRDFKTGGGYFKLNNSQIYLQDGGAAWSYESLLPVMARPWLLRFFNTYRTANCNIVRNFSPAYGAYFDVADEMGMMCENQYILEGAGNGTLTARIPGGDCNDPVWAANVKDEYKQWIEKDYNHPSVVMWSSSNEVFALSCSDATSALDRFIDFQQYIHSVDLSNRPVDTHGNQAYKTDPRFEIVNMHYPWPLSLLDNWQSVYGGRPVMMGEFYWDEDHRCKMSRDPNAAVAATAESEMANDYAYRINYAKGVNLPAMGVHNLIAQGYFCSSSLAKMGPWADLFHQPLSWYTNYWWDEYVPVQWPAESGLGYRHPYASCRWGGPINWFDPTRVEKTTNLCYDAVKNNFRAMPSLKSTMCPEMIVQVMGGPGASVLVTPLDGQPVSTQGVRTDDNGRAWFMLKCAGRYRVTIYVGSQTIVKDVTVSEWNLNTTPGYSYITRVVLRRSVKNDFDGDKITDCALARPSGVDWLWNIRLSSTGLAKSPAPIYGRYDWEDVPMPGDYDGDGITDLAVAREEVATGQWFWIIHYSSTGSDVYDRIGSYTWDTPISGDYDGDGRTDVAVTRPEVASGQFMWIIHQSSTGTEVYDRVGDTRWDTPIAGDYDGDGKTDVAVTRPESSWGQFMWIIHQSSTGTEVYDVCGDIRWDYPISGDYDGDGKTDTAVVRPESATGQWFYIINESSTGNEVYKRVGNYSTDSFITGDFDGDGKTDAASVQGGTNYLWNALRSSNGVLWQAWFGQSGDYIVGSPLTQ